MYRQTQNVSAGGCPTWDDHDCRTTPGQPKPDRVRGMGWGGFHTKHLRGNVSEQVCQENAKRSRTGSNLGSGRVGLGPMIKRLGGIRRVERLGGQPIRWSRLCFDSCCVYRVGDGDRLRMLVLGVMLLSMDLFVLLQILRSFERLLADLANVRFEWCMDCQVSTG